MDAPTPPSTSTAPRTSRSRPARWLAARSSRRRSPTSTSSSRVPTRPPYARSTWPRADRLTRSAASPQRSAGSRGCSTGPGSRRGCRSVGCGP
ncbi:hypothetical protein NKG94_10360 [Micromonospora sp. M12]